MDETKDSLRTIFNAAAELEDAAERAGYLDRACGGDAHLRQSIEKLLQAHGAAGSFFGGGTEATVLLPVKPGDRIGRYKILQKIGEGGCGVVYMAEQEEPVRRRIALKVIKLGMDTRQVVARFEAERQALAMMDHPNIARVLDGGATETGRPYFVMELVQGVPITEFCDKNKLPARERMRLFVQVCQAIQSAHQKGIIHRDIKPSNVLVTLHHGEPMPKVIDFGIAKATNQKLTEKTLFTHHATMIGTPAYMSPEQAEMTSMDVDTRTDVYSLGVLLYELLTGSTPFPEKRLRSLGYGEMQRVIVDEEPERPSTRLSTMANEQKTVVAKNRGEELAALSKLLRGDLDWVVMRCLEKDRRRRYDTPNELVADIERHLKNEPVVARPPSVGYRFQKLIRRNKLAFAAVTAVATALVLGAVVSTWQAVRARRLFADAEKARAGETVQRQQAEQQRNQALEATTLANQRAAEITRNLYFAEMNLAGQAAAEAGGISRIAELTAKWLPEKGAADQRGWEWYYLRSLLHQDLFTLREHTNAVNAVSWSPSGKYLASASADNTIKIWDVDSREVIHTLRRHTNGVKSIAWSLDEKRLASGSPDSIRIWDAASGREIHTLRGHTNGVNSVAWSPDGKRLVSGSEDHTVKVWDVASEQVIQTLHAHSHAVMSVAWSPDGERLASGSDDNTIKVWDAASGQETHTPLRGHIGGVISVAWSPDGKRLASGAGDHKVMVWDAASGTNIHILRGLTGGPWSVSWSPDGKRLAAGSEDNTIKVWDAASGKETLTLRGHTSGVLSVSWSPDGKRLVSGSYDNTLKVWDAGTEGTFTLHGHQGFINSVAWSPDGKRLAWSNDDNTVKVWDAASGTNIHTLRGLTERVYSVSWSPDGKRLASGGTDNTIKVWDIDREQVIHTRAGHSGAVVKVSWSPDGKHMASGSWDGTVKIWDAASGANTLTFTNSTSQMWVAQMWVDSYVWSVAWNPDGKHLAGGFSDAVKIWDAVSGQVIHSLPVQNTLVMSVSWSPDGKRLAVSRWDKMVMIWDVANEQVIHRLRGHSGPVGSVAWSPDGKRLASVSHDNTVKIWDAASGEQTVTLHEHKDGVFSVSWNPDGKRLASGSWDGTVKIWDARKGYELKRE